MHIWPKFENPDFNRWWLMARTNSQAQNGVNLDFEVKFDLEGARSITTNIDMDLNQGLLHLWSKFGDPSLNGSRVIARTSKWLTHRLTHTRTHRDACYDNTRRPKLASGKNVSLPYPVRQGNTILCNVMRLVLLSGLFLTWCHLPFCP